MRGLSVVAASAACLVCVSTTSADPVTGGRSTLTPDGDALADLAEMRIDVDLTGRAVATAEGPRFPIVDGEVEVRDTVKALLKHAGGLEFSDRYGNSVKFSKFTVSIIRDRLRVFARSEHAEVRFLDIAPTDISGTSSSMTMTRAKVALAKPGAEILTATFGVPFRKGDEAGRFTVRAVVDSAG